MVGTITGTDAGTMAVIGTVTRTVYVVIVTGSVFVIAGSVAVISRTVTVISVVAVSVVAGAVTVVSVVVNVIFRRSRLTIIRFYSLGRTVVLIAIVGIVDRRSVVDSVSAVSGTISSVVAVPGTVCSVPSVARS